MNYILFMWDSKPKNFIKVCLESLRKYNKDCKIIFYYNNEDVKNKYEKFNIIFKKINNDICNQKFQYYKILVTKNLLESINNNDKLLVLDCDLLFQNDPFILFDNNIGDLYYTHSILSTLESLREEKIWKSVDYKVNGGVWGIIRNKNSLKFINFWIENILNNTWDKWKNYKYHIEHGLENLNWWVDQDFLNCVDIYELPFELKKINVGYKFNYFTSTWGFFNENLEMGSKIGNSEYVIIHFKANFKDVYNLENSKIYNMKNILEKKKLTTDESIERITKKFLSRGEKRFHIV
jgi:hypothetical protein